MRRDAPPIVHLAAFGKHPAWNDHMEDINLHTVTFLEAKRYIYLQGISGQIDSGAWDKPSGVAGYDHWLLWHRPGEMLLGRLLASSDGKGRTRYPFVVLAHIINLPLAAALASCAPLLEEIARQARAAESPEKMRQIIVHARVRLADAAAAAPDLPTPLPPGVSPQIDATGWARIYHVLENQLHPYGPGARPQNPPCRHLRIPAASSDPVQNLLWWAACWLTQLEPQVPELLISPAHAGWLDLIVGEPASAHFRCLLSGPAAIPPVTETPYNLSPHIVKAAQELCAGADGDAIPPRSLFHLKPATRDVALATIGTRRGLAAATRPAGLLKKLFS